jgi:hypothetical protein
LAPSGTPGKPGLTGRLWQPQLAIAPAGKCANQGAQRGVETKMATPSWTPAVEIDLATAGAAAFQEALAKFYEWSRAATPPPPLNLQNGWYDITPQMAEDLLRRNLQNRKISLATVRKYYQAMKALEWKKTGQPVLINQQGRVEDAQHRLVACYLGNVTFPSYIVADVPVAADLFAYIDDSKPRNAADALFTSGNNGLSATIASTIKLAWRYENQAIAILKQPRIRDMTNMEILDFSRSNPQLGNAAHLLVGTYARAASVIGNKAVATFFVWKVNNYYGSDQLDEFMTSLGSGALLPEDSPILALRNRLLGEQDIHLAGEELRAPRRLALLIKAFLLNLKGEKMGKRGLSLRDNERFPRIEPPIEQQEAA